MDWVGARYTELNRNQNLVLMREIMIALLFSLKIREDSRALPDLMTTRGHMQVTE